MDATGVCALKWNGETPELESASPYTSLSSNCQDKLLDTLCQSPDGYGDRPVLPLIRQRGPARPQIWPT